MCMINDDKRLRQAAACLEEGLYEAVLRHESRLSRTVREIRLRLDKPLAAVCADGALYFTKGGRLTLDPRDDPLICTRAAIDATVRKICDYSLYARQNELNRGFVTVAGGHRAGICGTAVTERGRVVNVRGITSVNLRVTREFEGCARTLLDHVRASDGLLICGEPCSGKTTLLRDIARYISLNKYYNVSVIDERGELMGKTVNGAAQNELGFCDVYDGYPKPEGIAQAIRSMSPDVVVCDEIGSSEDVEALRLCASSGVRVVATVHAATPRDLQNKPALNEALRLGVFPNVVFLKGRGDAGAVARVMKGGEALAA